MIRKVIKQKEVKIKKQVGLKPLSLKMLESLLLLMNFLRKNTYIKIQDKLHNYLKNFNARKNKVKINETC